MALRTMKLLAGKVVDMEVLVLVVPLLLMWPTSLHLLVLSVILLPGALMIGVLAVVLMR